MAFCTNMYKIAKITHFFGNISFSLSCHPWKSEYPQLPSQGKCD